MTSCLNLSGDESPECPLCMEFLELDDINFYPCTCGYQVTPTIRFRLKTIDHLSLKITSSQKEFVQKMALFLNCVGLANMFLYGSTCCPAVFKRKVSKYEMLKSCVLAFHVQWENVLRLVLNCVANQSPRTQTCRHSSLTNNRQFCCC